VFIGLGINEAMPMPFLAPGDLAAAGLETAGIAIANPLVADESVLRTSLRPGLLRVIGANAARRAPVTAWFEIGHVFLTPPAGQLLPDEPELLSVALAGQSAADAVRVLSEVFGELGREVELAAGEFPGLHPTRAAAVLIDDLRVGLVGEVDPDVAARFGAVGAVGWLELDLDLIDAAGGSPHVYRAVSRYPSNDVDLAFVVPETVPASAIRAALVSAAGDLLGSILLFDVYRGTAISAGSRSLAFALSLQAADRTLTDTDVGEIRARCIDAVEAAGGTLRS
jgi:phenylalanyl-tRNA synthetase beta chain